MQGGITSSPAWRWFSLLQATGVPTEATAACCCMLGETETQPRSLQPHHCGPGHCHWAILLTAGYLSGVERVVGVFRGEAASEAPKALTCSGWVSEQHQGGQAPAARQRSALLFSSASKTGCPGYGFPN